MSDIVYKTQNANTPSIQSGTVALSSNPARMGWMIQNCGTAVLYVLLGNGASTTVFHTALKVSTTNDDGTGGAYEQRVGTIYTGPVSVAGSPLRYVVTEIAP